MARTSAWRSALLVAAVAAAGCTEKLTTPAICPAVCLGNNLQLADTLLAAADSADTTAVGYVLASAATFAAASTLDSLRSVVVLRFSPLDTFWEQVPGDTIVAAFPPDSVQLLLDLTSVDSAAHPKLVFYRLPAAFDTTLSYAQAMAYFADSAVLDTAPVPDSAVMTVRLPRSLYPGPNDARVVSIGFKLVADSPTVVGMTTGQQGTGRPSLTYFVKGRPPNDTLSRNLVVSDSGTGAFVGWPQSPVPGTLAHGVLAVGGLPAAHTLLHLQLPKVAVDSAGIVRATLLLQPLAPAITFPGDSFEIVATPLLRDYGPKSILYPDTLYNGYAWVHYGQTSVVDLDIAFVLRLWGAAAGDSLPRAIMLSVAGEANGLTGFLFGGRGAGAGPPLRVTYVKKYEIGVP